MTSSALCGLLFAISTHMHSLKLHAPVFMCEAQMTYKHAGFMEKVRGHLLVGKISIVMQAKQKLMR